MSAHLFCLARPGVELGPVDWCPTGSELTIRAEPPLGRSLSTVSVVACADRRPCERVSSAHFEREEVQLLAGPKLEIPGKIDVVVVWSDQDLGQLLAGQVAHVGEVPALALPKGWIQAGFSLRTSDAPSP